MWLIRIADCIRELLLRSCDALLFLEDTAAGLMITEGDPVPQFVLPTPRCYFCTFIPLEPESNYMMTTNLEEYEHIETAVLRILDKDDPEYAEVPNERYLLLEYEPRCTVQEIRGSKRHFLADDAL